MRRITGFVLSVAAALFLIVSCSNPSGSDAGITNEEKNTVKKSCKVSFSNNVPDDIYNWGCSASSPDTITVKEGEEITVPLFKGELQEYENNIMVRTYSFVSWNTDKNGKGTEYVSGSKMKVTEDIILYAIYEKTGKNVSGNGEDEDPLDFSIKTSYSLKIGESMKLASVIEGYDVFYQVQNGDDAVSVSGNEVKGEAVGDAVIVAEAWNDSTKKWYCTFTVTAEGFSGTALDYKLIGKWFYDEESYIIFNSDKTGEMKVYLNGSVAQDTTFTWYSFKNSYGEYFVVENSSSNVNGQYTIKRLDASTLRFNGRLAFGLPQETEWSKEQGL